MIRHAVCFNLHDPSKSNCQKAKEMLLSMKGKVPQVKDIWVGIDQLRSPRSCDILLLVTVDDFDALEAYQKDPYHHDVVSAFMHDVSKSTVSADCEL